MERLARFHQVVKSARSASAVPSERLIASTLKPAERFDAWHDAVSNVVDVIPLDNDGLRSGTSFTAWRLDGLLMSEASYCPHSAARTPGGRTATAVEFVRLFVTLTGSSHLVVADQINPVLPGEVHIVDYSRPWREVAAEPHALLAVFLPHAVIGYDPARHPAHIRFPLDAPFGRIIGDALFSILEQIPRLGRAETPAIAAGFGGLIRGLVRFDPQERRDTRPVRNARRQAIARFVDENLFDPDLDVGLVCRNFGAARATIYRDFAEEGGLAHLIAKRRLERAFLTLADHPPVRGAVARTAERCCFESHSHFTRQFRRHFGFPPSEVVGVGHCGAAGQDTDGVSFIPAATHGDAARRLGTWLSSA